MVPATCLWRTSVHPSYLAGRHGGGLVSANRRTIRVKVNASSKSEGVRVLEEGYYQVRTRAPAERGRANKRVLQLLAAEFGCAIEALTIVSGATKPVKIVAIDV